jgi:glutamate-1-semialdehyde 2,1-aminomutase
VTDGRDTTTVIFPSAEAKFFVTATVRERARRRGRQLEAKGLEVDLEALSDDIRARDLSDRERPVGPLRLAEGAALIDSTKMTLEQVVDTLVDRVEAIRSNGAQTRRENTVAETEAAAATEEETPLTRTQRSEGLYARATGRLPGGVSSPVRAFRAVGGTPRFIERGEGCRMTDVDGNTFIDYCMSWGPLALGHAHPEVIAEVNEAIAKGLTFGAPTEAEVQLAERVARLQPLCEKVRFVSSGTEAVMSAVRVARGYTGRPLVVKFDGCYHGHADYLLVKAGSGLATAGQPSSAGVPEAIAGTTIVLPLDDEKALYDLFEERGDQIAAVLIEPLPANAGLLKQRSSFLISLAEVCDRAGALLIFDEVITGFRLGPGGAAEMYGIQPDLLTYGKVIGGGMPVGAYGGSAKIMSVVAPDGPVYQAGTLSGNPIAMTAGLKTLEILEREGWDQLEKNARKLEAALDPVLEAAPLTAGLAREGSIFWMFFAEDPPRRWDRVDRGASAEIYARFHRGLLKRGVYLAPSAFEVFFVSTAHDDEAIEHTREAFAEALVEAAG